eukprot:GILI01029992.1.p1 GENE.GILI01029992.1~~GILI01029992.1.p1  ORF type:complete len:190 (-),score=16.85 GILI01029992.1:35-604(-)
MQFLYFIDPLQQSLMKRSRSPEHVDANMNDTSPNQTKPQPSSSKDIPVRPINADHVNLYKNLNVPHNSTNAELRVAMKKAALKHHPDRNVGREEEAKLQFQAVNEAFAVLLDDGKRRQHDTRLGLNFGSKVGDLMSQMHAHHSGHHHHHSHDTTSADAGRPASRKADVENLSTSSSSSSDNDSDEDFEP